DSGAEITNKELDSISMLVSPDRDFLPILGVADRIADQVTEDLMNGVPIGRYAPIAHVFNCEFDAGSTSCFLKRRRGFNQQFAHRVRAQIKLILAGFNACQHQQVFGEATHALRITPNYIKKLLGALREGTIGLKKGFRITTDGSQRSAQFM